MVRPVEMLSLVSAKSTVMGMYHGLAGECFGRVGSVPPIGIWVVKNVLSESPALEIRGRTGKFGIERARETARDWERRFCVLSSTGGSTVKEAAHSDQCIAAFTTCT